MKTKLTAKKSPRSVSALEALFKLHDGIRNRGEYEILGQVETIDCTQGRIAFFGAGPVIARSASPDDRGALIVLTPFTGLPDIITVSDAHCTKCLAPCDVCDGKGKITCSLTQGCRGSGKMKIPMGACSCTSRGPGLHGAPRKSCRKCKGAGSIVEMRECDGCKGTKLETCNQCRGEGRYATGKVDASTNIHAKLCAACNGTQRDIVREPQEEEKFIALAGDERLKGLRSIGGISRMVWKDMELAEALNGQPNNILLRTCEISPDSQGKLMSLFIDSASNMYCMRGIPRLM